MIPLIIPAYEPDDRLIELLNSLKEYSYGPVIIVDDGSGYYYKYIFEKVKHYGGGIK